MSQTNVPSHLTNRSEALLRKLAAASKVAVAFADDSLHQGKDAHNNEWSHKDFCSPISLSIPTKNPVMFNGKFYELDDFMRMSETPLTGSEHVFHDPSTGEVYPFGTPPETLSAQNVADLLAIYAFHKNFPTPSPPPPPFPSPPPIDTDPSFEDGAATSAAVLSHLRHLARHRTWRAVVERTSDLLFATSSSYHFLVRRLVVGDGGGPDDGDPGDATGRECAECAEILLLRMTALVQLGDYAECLRECGEVGLLPPPAGATEADVDAYLRTERAGWVPLGLTVMAAELASLRDARQCADALRALRGGILRLHADQGGSFPPRRWIGRIDEALANVYVRMQAFRLALGVLQDMLEEAERHATEEVDELRELEPRESLVPPHVWNRTTEALWGAARAEIYGRAGRIFLQMGANEAARKTLRRADEAWTAAAKAGEAVERDPRGETAARMLRGYDAYAHGRAAVLADKALLLCADKKYEDASAMFVRAMVDEKDEVDLPDFTDFRLLLKMASFPSSDVLRPSPFSCPSALRPGIGISMPESPAACSLDNIGLCSLYSCRLPDAVSILEGMIHTNPQKYMTQVLVFNLCTLYDLSNSQEGSVTKKKELVALANKLNLHDVGTEVFRIGT